MIRPDNRLTAFDGLAGPGPRPEVERRRAGQDSEAAPDRQVAWGLDFAATGLKVARLDAGEQSPTVVDVAEATAGIDPALRSATGLDAGSARRHVSHWCKQRIADARPEPSAAQSAAVLILAAHLGAIKEHVSRPGARRMEDVTLAVPAYFTHRAHELTREACRRAGLRLRATPCDAQAAAFDFLTEDRRDPLRVMTYDLGGSFNVAVLDKRDGRVVVRAFDGDRFVGGFDFDHSLANWLLYRLGESGYDVTPAAAGAPGPAAHAGLLDLAEETKLALSSCFRYKVHGMIGWTERPIGFSLEIRRAEFEQVISSQVDHTIGLCRRAIDQACDDPGADMPLGKRRARGELDEVVLLGGSSRIPLVGRRLAEELGGPPVRAAQPEYAPAMGAARMATGKEDSIPGGRRGPNIS